MEPRESIETSTLHLPHFNDAETEGREDPVREEVGHTVESLRPRRPRIAVRRTITRQQVIARLAPAWRVVTGRRFVTSVAVLALLIAVLAIILLPNLPPQVRVTAVKQDNIIVTVSASGTLQSAIYDANFTGNGGKIAEIDVLVGQQVTDGQTLAKLDTTLLQDRVSEAQATVMAAQSHVSSAESNQTKTEAQASAEVNAAYSKEQADLAKCGNDTRCQQAAMDAYAAAQAKASNENAAAAAAVSDAQSQLSTAQAQLQTAQDTLAGATLTAPHAGTVAAINSTVGSVIGGSGSSTTSGAPFIRIADLDALQVQAYVSVGDVNSVEKGQSARFNVPSAGPNQFHGSVSTVSPLGRVNGGALQYPVTIDVDTASVQAGHLLPGMAAEARITTVQRFGVLVVPMSAVTFAHSAADLKHGGFLTRSQVQMGLANAQQLMRQAEDNGTDVTQATPTYVLERKGTGWSVRPVLLGATNGTVYEVLAGLKKGEQVATGETNVLGFTVGPATPTPTPAPASK